LLSSSKANLSFRKPKVDFYGADMLAGVEERLANPTAEMLPPKVYENKVTIYGVRVDDEAGIMGLSFF
jgi:hypothetical protein